MRTLYHTVAALVAATLIGALLTKSYIILTVATLWYLVGIFAAISHLRWQESETLKKPTRSSAFIWWYSLNGLILLATTKIYEIWHERTA